MDKTHTNTHRTYKFKLRHTHMLAVRAALYLNKGHGQRQAAQMNSDLRNCLHPPQRRAVCPCLRTGLTGWCLTLFQVIHTQKNNNYILILLTKYSFLLYFIKGLFSDADYQGKSESFIILIICFPADHFLPRCFAFSLCQTTTIL